MYENEWFPQANAMGVTWNEFWKLNPHIIKLLIKGDNEKQKKELEMLNIAAYNQGQYFTHSILCTVGNMLGGKQSKKHKYPSKPFEIYKKEVEEEFTEEQLQEQREAFVAKLMTLKYNFDAEQRNKNKENKGDSV